MATDQTDYRDAPYPGQKPERFSTVENGSERSVSEWYSSATGYVARQCLSAADESDVVRVALVRLSHGEKGNERFERDYDLLMDVMADHTPETFREVDCLDLPDSNHRIGAQNAATQLYREVFGRDS